MHILVSASVRALKKLSSTITVYNTFIKGEQGHMATQLYLNLALSVVCTYVSYDKIGI